VTRWIHPDHFYKSGCALEAHFGLGKQAAADLKVTLPSGKTATFVGVRPDVVIDVELVERYPVNRNLTAVDTHEPAGRFTIGGCRIPRLGRTWRHGRNRDTDDSRASR
jgi:hypothetical protein